MYFEKWLRFFDDQTIKCIPNPIISCSIIFKKWLRVFGYVKHFGEKIYAFGELERGQFS